MSKPDWKDAPEWANWLAMDGDGRVFWYEKMPKPGLSLQVWNPTSGKARLAGASSSPSWIDTLEERSRG